MTAKKDMPRKVDLMWPMLRALEGLGGSASARALDERVATDMALDEAVLGVARHDEPRREFRYKSEFGYRCEWTRARLRGMGAVEEPLRRVWAITESGRRIESADEMLELARRHQKKCDARHESLWTFLNACQDRHDLGSRRPTMEEAVATSERNLKQQLAIPRHLRRGYMRSFASGMNPNPRLWKYRWRIFVTRPDDPTAPSKEYTWEMPEMTHAEFKRRVEWLEARGIQFGYANSRQRREHPLWNAETVASERLAPAFEKDSDPIASDGHR